MSETLHMAYADPPYIGQSKKHYGDHPDYAGEVDHDELVSGLVDNYPDGWALSLSSPSTQIVLDHCRDHGLSLVDGDIRLMAWVKPFAAFKRNVRVAYAWEPVIVKPAVRLEGATPTRDFVAEGDNDETRPDRREARSVLLVAVRGDGFAAVRPAG